MKTLTTAVAYPTIPIIFLGGINPDRTPLYDTMGLAITSKDSVTRTETTIKQSSKSAGQIDFFLNGKKIEGKRGKQIITAVKDFMDFGETKGSLTIHSQNYNIFSGSSDSGLAALFTALNDFFEYNLTQDELLQFAMKGSESAGRSLYGGLTLTKANPLSVKQLASDNDLALIRLFSIAFDFPVRLSADEIHAGIVTNSLFSDRLNKIPFWVEKISNALISRDYLSVLEYAEENIRNAHELLEGVNLVVRKAEVMKLCNNITEIRETGIPAFYLIGGGNLVTVATIDKYYKETANYLNEKNWKYIESKVAGHPVVIKSEK
ncbi:MAG: hypothetical protein FK733_08770 [Asgard group archaeon]|nr:hypothetical protein [Asgard group archaeon]